MADASDSKSDAGNSVWVQVPSPALTQKSRKHAIFIEKSKVYGFFFNALYVIWRLFYKFRP